MSNETRPPSYPLRLEPETRLKLEKQAKINGRSLNAEIAMRLEESLQNSDHTAIDESLGKEIRRIALEVVQEELAKQSK